MKTKLPPIQEASSKPLLISINAIRLELLGGNIGDVGVRQVMKLPNAPRPVIGGHARGSKALWSRALPSRQYLAQVIESGPLACCPGGGRVTGVCRCKVEKATTEFHKNRATHDGLQHRCKACHLLANQEWAERRGSAEVRRMRNDRNDPGYRVVLSPEQRRAHHAIERALEAGHLVRPSACSECGKDRRPFRHTTPPTTTGCCWLSGSACSRCHMRLHAREKQTQLQGATQ